MESEPLTNLCWCCFGIEDVLENRTDHLLYFSVLIEKSKQKTIKAQESVEVGQFSKYAREVLEKF